MEIACYSRFEKRRAR